VAARGNRSSTFAKNVERTVEGVVGFRSTPCEDARKSLSIIRQQYDEVKVDADALEAHLEKLREEGHLVQLQEVQLQEDKRLCTDTTAEVEHELEAVKVATQQASTDRIVYMHMISRLQRETVLVRQKVKKMEEHLVRKRADLKNHKHLNRRAHLSKLEVSHALEALNQEVHEERELCNSALGDLDVSVQQERQKIQYQHEFEKWRCEVAHEAALEAHLAILSRYQKLWSLEKLVGNCLQKVIIEQVERSQATEEGFQKIREVSGLSEVPDIVHKFVNREQDFNQLRGTVRETEVRLQELRALQANRHLETTAEPQDFTHLPQSLIAEVQHNENELKRAHDDLEQHRNKLHEDIILMDSVVQWGQHIPKSIALFTDVQIVAGPVDVVPFFRNLAQIVEKFFQQVGKELPAKVTRSLQSCHEKESVEQNQLLGDTSFLRANLRVPLHRNKNEGGKTHTGRPSRLPQQAVVALDEEDRQSAEIATERERLRAESLHRYQMHAPPSSRHSRRRRGNSRM